MSKELNEVTLGMVMPTGKGRIFSNGAVSGLGVGTTRAVGLAMDSGTDCFGINSRTSDFDATGVFVTTRGFFVTTCTGLLTTVATGADFLLEDTLGS